MKYKSLLRYTHSLGLLGYTVNINWETTTTDLSSENGALVLNIGPDVLDYINKYSTKKGLPMTNFKSNTDIIYRALLSVNSEITELINSTKIPINTYFSVDVSMGEYYDVVKKLKGVLQ